MHYVQGYTQIIPCYTGTGCGSGDVGTQSTVFGCCNISNTLSYRPAIGIPMPVCHVMVNCALIIATHIPWAEKPQFTKHTPVRQCPVTFQGKCMLSCITIGRATQSMPYPLLVASGPAHYVQISTSFDLCCSFARIKEL